MLLNQSERRGQIYQTGDFSHLPLKTQQFLKDFSYKGVTPVTTSVDDDEAAIIFATVDAKITPEDKFKALEFNGVNSMLDVYPGYRYGLPPVARIYDTLAALDLPLIALVNPRTTREQRDQIRDAD